MERSVKGNGGSYESENSYIAPRWQYVKGSPTIIYRLIVYVMSLQLIITRYHLLLSWLVAVFNKLNTVNLNGKLYSDVFIYPT